MRTDAELATIPRAVANERPYKIQCRFCSINEFVNDDMDHALTNFTKTDLYRIHACFGLPLYVQVAHLKKNTRVTKFVAK
jgi:hypothetical protein